MKGQFQMYIIQASPLTKIFLEEHKAKCLQDPTYVFNNDPFEILIHRPVGAVKLIHNKPVLASTLIPRMTKIQHDDGKNFSMAQTRKIEDDEVQPLLDWLTNETNHETDAWGVVAVQIESDFTSAIMSLAMGDEKGKKAETLMKEVQANLRKSIVDARERADIRVKKACGHMYETVRATYDFMKREGKGVYQASFSEALAMSVLKEEIKRNSAPVEAAQRSFEQTLSSLEGNVHV